MIENEDGTDGGKSGHDYMESMEKQT